MKTEKRKQMLSDYKNKQSDMGVFAVSCKTTGHCFIGWSKDTKAFINRTRFQLEMGSHPNKNLQTMWNDQGETNFTISTIELLPYDEKAPDKDYTEALEQLHQKHLTSTPNSHPLK